MYNEQCTMLQAQYKFGTSISKGYKELFVSSCSLIHLYPRQGDFRLSFNIKSQNKLFIEIRVLNSLRQLLKLPITFCGISYSARFLIQVTGPINH